MVSLLETERLQIPSFQGGYLDFIAAWLIGDRKRVGVGIGGCFENLRKDDVLWCVRRACQTGAHLRYELGNVCRWGKLEAKVAVLGPDSYKLQGMQR